MAYVKFNNIDDAAWLETYGDNFYIRNGKVYRRKKPKRPKVYSPWIQRIVETFKATGAAWQVTPDVDRAIWKQYIPFAPNSISHYNAMLTCNVRARYPRIPALIDGPLGPRVPADSPHTPNGLKLDYISASNYLKITWDPDYTELAYVQVFHFILPGRRRHRPHWKYIESHYANAGIAYIPGYKLSAGHISMVSIRALNAYGEISDFAEPEEEEIEEAPVPLFSGTPLEGDAPLDVQFTDESTGTIYDYLWDFGDGQYSLEQNPLHQYTGEDKYFHVTLGIWGPGESNPNLRKVRYIHTLISPLADQYFWICDTYNHRIMKRAGVDLGYISKIGTEGSGLDQFKRPWHICADASWLYLMDKYNHRIMRRQKSNLAWVSNFGSYGFGNNNFAYPSGIDCDGTYLYICDTSNNRIKKHLKGTLAYVSHLGHGGGGSGDNQFKYPAGIACDDTYLYIADRANHRIKKHLKSDLSYVAKTSTFNGQNFSSPYGIAVDDQYVYCKGNVQHFLVKLNKSDLSYVDDTGTWGSGDDQFFSVSDVAVDDGYIYIMDSGNHRIKRHRKDTLAYVDKIGESGSGDDQFNQPQGVTVTSRFQS